jgi:nucleotide-binding universal stress UspA family protein
VPGRMFARILVGFDGSPSAGHALQVAARIAGEAGHAEVVALAVVPPARGETDGDRRRTEQATRTELERCYAAALPGRPAAAQLRTIEGRQVAHAIARYAEERGFDLVVLGRHGADGALHPHVGHITDTLVRNERLAVLLAPEPG